jgi:NAD(P)-dependent dehydrogenase (short-subunit alcohol dehydrogenase family)
MQLHGLNALVTGASRGLGRSLALELARHGARVALVAHGIVADVADKDAAHRIAGAAAGALGEVDLLVHNASALGPLPMPPLLDTHCEDLARVLEVNLVGPFRLTRALAGSMALRRRGTVLFVSSDAAVEPYPGWGAYGVSKAAADHLARVWAEELRPAGVTVAAIDPGEMEHPHETARTPPPRPSSPAGTKPMDRERRRGVASPGGRRAFMRPTRYEPVNAESSEAMATAAEH